MTLKYFYQNKGVTLIEVIIVLALLSIVGLIVGTIFSYGLRSYETSITQKEEQGDVRLVAEFITNEVRNSFTLETRDNKDSIIEYLFFVNDEVFYRQKKDESAKAFTNKTIQSINFMVEVDALDNYFLNFDIVGVNGFTMTSKVLLNNIETADVDASIINKEKSVLTYQKP